MNPFQVLGLAPGVTMADAKARYRELVKRHHPDAGGDEERFKRIQAAWEMLTGRRRTVPPPRRPRQTVVVTVMTFTAGNVTVTSETSAMTGNW